MPTPKIILIELPTFPKGVLSLSLSAVIAAFPRDIETTVLDLNIHALESVSNWDEFLFVGVKVSSQNVHIAKEISEQLNENFPSIQLVWGGEFPTLLPHEATKYCTAIVQGAFEPVAQEIVQDAIKHQLKKHYDGRANYDLRTISIPRVTQHYTVSNYYSFMGVPIETSRGCDKKCTFCMVHTMQNKNDFKTPQLLAKELEQYTGHFINVVDYNIGVSEDHLLKITGVFEQSRVLGWMGEMCLESLDNDVILAALQKSRCRIIYCGLESLDEQSLKSVNKSKTNVLQNYERIIRKVQSYDIQIAAGLILGIEGMTLNSFTNTLQQFNEWGIIYTKMTFLTYNPGTKVKNSMRKKGKYVTEKLEAYDGNHLSFIANDVAEEDVYVGTERYIEQFYSFSNIHKRSQHLAKSPDQQKEFILFNLLYRQVYLDWQKHHIFSNDANFDSLLNKKFKKNRKIKRLEYLLKQVRIHLFNSKRT